MRSMPARSRSRPLPWLDEVRAPRTQRLRRGLERVHRLGFGRARGADLDWEALVAALDHHVDLGAGLGAEVEEPRARVREPLAPGEVLEHEGLPAHARDGV